ALPDIADFLPQVDLMHGDSGTLAHAKPGCVEEGYNCSVPDVLPCVDGRCVEELVHILLGNSRSHRMRDLWSFKAMPVIESVVPSSFCRPVIELAEGA